MKGRKRTVFSSLFNWLEQKYRAPEDCKLVMADRNLNTMIKVQPFLIALGVYGVFVILLKNSENLIPAIPRLFYFGEYIVFGLLILR